MDMWQYLTCILNKLSAGMWHLTRWPFFCQQPFIYKMPYPFMPSFHIILAWWWQVIVGEIMLEEKDHGSKQEFYRPSVVLRVMARRASELPWCDVHLNIILDLVWYFSKIVQAHKYFLFSHWWIFHLFCGHVGFLFKVNWQDHQNHF